jgi:hypothetical protein
VSDFAPYRHSELTRKVLRSLVPVICPPEAAPLADDIVEHMELARALDQLMSLSCYEQPAMAEHVGYRVGPWIEKVTQKRLTVFRDDVRKQEAQILAPDPLRPGVNVRALRSKAGA